MSSQILNTLKTPEIQFLPRKEINSLRSNILEKKEEENLLKEGKERRQSSINTGLRLSKLDILTLYQKIDTFSIWN